MKKSIVKTLLIIAAVSALSMGATVGCSTQPKDAQEDLSIVNKLQGDWFQETSKYTFKGKEMSFTVETRVFTHTFISNVTGHSDIKWARYSQGGSFNDVFYRYVDGADVVHLANHELVFDPSNPSGVNPGVYTRTPTTP